MQLIQRRKRSDNCLFPFVCLFVFFPWNGPPLPRKSCCDARRFIWGGENIEKLGISLKMNKVIVILQWRRKKRFICLNKSRLNAVFPDAPRPLFQVISQPLLFDHFFFVFLLTRCAAAFKTPHLENKRRGSDSTRLSWTWLLVNLSRARGSGSLIMTSAHIFPPSSVLFWVCAGSVRACEMKGGLVVRQPFTHKDWMTKEEEGKST